MSRAPPGPLWKRLGWFVLLWGLGVLVVGTISLVLRWWLK